MPLIGVSMISSLKKWHRFLWLLVTALLMACEQQPAPVFDESYVGPVPTTAVARLGKGTAHSISLLNNGRDVIVGSNVGVSRYDGETLEPLWQTVSTVPVLETAVSPDEQWLLVGLADGGLWLLDAESGEVSQSLPGYNSEIGVTALAWQPSETDAYHIAVGFNDGNILLAAVAAGDVQNVGAFPKAGSGVVSLAFNPDGRILAASSRTGSILILDVGTQLRLGQLDGHETGEAILALDWSAAGDMIVSGNKSGEIIEWDMRQFEPLNRLPSQTEEIITLAYLADGEQFVAISADGRVTMWPSGGSEPAQTWQSGTTAVHAADWAAEAYFALVDGAGPIDVWAYTDGEFRDMPTATLHGYGAHVDQVTAVDYSPDGNTLASTLGDDVMLWQTDDYELKHRLAGHETAVASLVWSPDSQQIASADRDGVIRIWNADDGELVKRWQAHERPITSLAWSPNGEKLLSVGSLDDTAVIWNIITLEPVHTIHGEGDGLWSTAWSPNGELVVVGSTEGKMFFWNAENPGDAPEATAFRHLSWVTDMEWFPDSEHLVSGGAESQVIIWNVPQRNSAVLPGHSQPVRGVAVHPEGGQVASASLDDLVVVWGADLNSAYDIEQILPGHAEGVTAVDWAPDGQTIASGSEDGTVIIWKMEGGE